MGIYSNKVVNISFLNAVKIDSIDESGIHHQYIGYTNCTFYYFYLYYANASFYGQSMVASSKCCIHVHNS